MNEVDDEFYSRADAHINLSNDQISENIGKGKVSASFMYSLSRFNAWVSASGWNSQQEMKDSKEETIEYFMTEFRKMLDENFDDYMSAPDRNIIECSKHGESYTTYICTHLINKENKEWYSDTPSEDNEWPDAWCGECQKHYEAKGEWNEKSENAAGTNSVQVLCHNCYSELRSSCNKHYLES